MLRVCLADDHLSCLSPPPHTHILIIPPALLQIRIVVERLSRRCGFEAMAAAMPAADAKLLTHIRKEVGGLIPLVVVGDGDGTGLGLSQG